MANNIYKKVEAEDDVYTAALKRFHLLFDRFDKVVVSFSGGKDSTVCLNLALQVAEERGELPLDVYFWDEEAIQPETVAYVARVAADPRVRLKWLCVPVKHRNACSRQEPYWYPWLEADRHKWVRDLPEGAVRESPGFYPGASVPEIAHRVYGPEHGLIADVRGIRADESIRRYRSVANKLKDNWIGQPRDGYSAPVSPIYDWTSFDVWTAPRMFGWDYNRTYDLMSLAGMQINDQRVCPPYGEEPLKGLWIYAQCWPDLWHKMIGRVHGAATAGRYAKTELYGFGQITCPPGMTYREWCYSLLELYPPALRAQVARSVADLLADHRTKTRRPLDETRPDPVSGLSWRYLAMIANRGDLKQRRAGAASTYATAERNKRGITLEQAEDRDDGTRY